MKIIASGPNKIPVRMTDEYLRYQDAESAYLVTFLYDETIGMCTAHLEGVTFHHVQQQQTWRHQPPLPHHSQHPPSARLKKGVDMAIVQGVNRCSK